MSIWVSTDALTELQWALAEAGTRSRALVDASMPVVIWCRTPDEAHTVVDRVRARVGTRLGRVEITEPAIPAPAIELRRDRARRSST